ncbi:MAG: hypothetical protein JW822_13750 [Spirochaetales bacterium]|nr:hypothetical protein [Spirochaetales bacterium]
MKKRVALIIDAVINALLGVLLLLFPLVADFLGVPASDTNFYPNILGAAFIGITLALLVEAFRKDTGKHVGLGMIGAICINMCGGIVLTLWLLFGGLSIPLRGQIFLWALAFILLVISSVELVFTVKKKQ